MKGKYVPQHNKHGLNIVIGSDGAQSSVIKVEIERIGIEYLGIYLLLKADLSARSGKTSSVSKFLVSLF